MPCEHRRQGAIERVPGRRRRGGKRLLPAGGARLHLSGTRVQCPNDKSSPLMVTATHGHADIVRMILARAPNTAVDYVGASGGTALVATAQYHHADILRLLAR